MNAIRLGEQQPFTYTVGPIALLANASLDVPLILGDDSEFDLQTILASTDVDNAGAVTLAPNNFTCLMKDVSSGRDFSSGPVPRSIFAGVSPTNAVVESRCIRFPRKRQLQFTVANTTGATIIVTIALKGYKFFTNFTPVA